MEPKHNNTGKYICAAIIGVSIIIGTVVIGTAVKNGFVSCGYAWTNCI